MPSRSRSGLIEEKRSGNVSPVSLQRTHGISPPGTYGQVTESICFTSDTPSSKESSYMSEISCFHSSPCILWGAGYSAV